MIKEITREEFNALRRRYIMEDWEDIEFKRWWVENKKELIKIKNEKPDTNI